MCGYSEVHSVNIGDDHVGILFLNYSSYCVQKHKIFPMTALYNTYKFKTDTSLRKYDLHFW